MKRWAMAIGILLLAAGICGAEEPAAKTESGTAPAQETKEAPAVPAPAEKAAPAEPKLDMDKVSYVIGLSVGKEMKSQGIDLRTDAFMKGVNDSLSGAKPSLTEAETQQIITGFRAELAAKKQAEAKKQAAENRQKEEAFLADNKGKEGVKTTPSGLQYKVLKEGDGKKPTAYDSVTVNYRGTLLDGTEFDSSYKRGQPATFPVGGVIPGWSEAIQLMKTGSKYQMFIPSKLGYGEAGVPGVIPPSATLVFEVELLSVKEAAEKETPVAPSSAKEKGAKKPNGADAKTTEGAAPAK
jgi:FKBP-type peptidyl-prolyl cis-trans isomerase FklB